MTNPHDTKLLDDQINEIIFDCFHGVYAKTLDERGLDTYFVELDDAHLVLHDDLKDKIKTLITDNYVLKERMVEAKDKIVELLAENEHATWASWMEWLFDEFECGTLNADGSFTIRPDRVSRWKRQLETKYADLPEEEKESDRMQVYEAVDHILKTLGLSDE